MADPIESGAALGVGAILGDSYEVVRLIGRGGMGAVWEARHRRLPGKRLAIKVLLVERIADKNVYARFRREAEIASRLGHPNIIEALDFNTLPDGTPYIVLEYLEGQTLAARIKQGPMSLPDTFAIVRQIGSALAAAHRAGIVHRDLKPDNIFLCPTDSGGEVSERVKILDFGISKIRDSQSIVTTDQTVLGTPQYMSPEQASAKHGEVDARTDQFALGAIVYEMLSGQAAFSGPTLVSVVYKVMTEHPEPLPRVRPQVSAKVGAAVERALSKRPENRYPDIAAFVEDLTGRPLMTLDKARAATGTTEAVAPASPAKARLPLSALFAAATFVIAVAAVTAVALRRTAPLPPPAPKSTVTLARPAPQPPVERPPVEKPAALQPPVVPPPVVKPPAPQAGVEKPPAPRPPGEKPARPKGHGESLPPALVAKLDAADAALAAGNASEAIRLARQSLTDGQSARAYAIVARAFCQQGDLGNARAQIAHVGGERARVVRECKAAGIDLQ